MRRIPFQLACLWTFLSSPLGAQESGFLGKTVASWLTELDASDASIRRGAAFALGKSGAKAVVALPKLVQALSDSDAGVRTAAGYAIGDIAATGHASWLEASEALQVALAHDENACVRRSAAYALGSFGPLAASSLAALQQALRDPAAIVRQNAAWALGRLQRRAPPEAITALSMALIDDDALVRRDAVSALGELGRETAHSAVHAILDCLKTDRDQRVRKVAVRVLTNLVMPEDKGLAADLRGLLQDREQDVARGAALALGNMGGSEAAAAVPVLRLVLRDEDATLRSQAAAALANMGPDASQAVPDLSTALSDRDPTVRRNAALALSRIGPQAVSAARALVRATHLREPNQVREFAAEALSKLDVAVLGVAPDLLRILKADPDPRVRQRAVWGLFKVVTEENTYGVNDALRAVLSEKDRASTLVRYDAARALALRLGSQAPAQTIDVLLDMLHDREPLGIYTRTEASVTSGDESAKGSSAVRPQTQGDARFLAAEALEQLGSRANRPDVVRALRAALMDKDDKLREAAKQALHEIERNS